MAPKTRSDIIEAVADAFGGFCRVVATGGSTTTIVDAANLLESDGYWVGHYVHVLTDAGGTHAAPEGQERPVTGYDLSSATLTVSPAFTAAIGAGDVCALAQERRTVFESAINEAIRAAEMTWLVAATDDAIVLDEEVYEYDLPTDLVTLNRVLVRAEDEEPWRDIPASNWRVTGLPGAQELVFNSWNGLSASYTTRLEYYARPAEMTTDAATLGVGEPAEREMVRFMTLYALYWLHSRAASKQESSGTFQIHYTQADSYLKMAMDLRARSAGSWREAGRLHTTRPSRARG